MNGTLCVPLYLLAQLAHVDAQILNVATRPPDFLHQKTVCQHLTRVNDKQPQNIVFLRGELYFLTSHRNESPHQVYAQISACEQGLTTKLLHTVPEGSADARHEFCNSEGLRNIIVRAQIESLDLAVLRTAA
jgi:hypothetical protein